MYFLKKIILLFIARGYVFNQKDNSFIGLLLHFYKISMEQKNEIIVLVLDNCVNNEEFLNNIVYNYVKYVNNPNEDAINIMKRIQLMGINLTNARIFEIPRLHPDYSKLFMPYYT
jgi:hypothetical protein